MVANSLSLGATTTAAIFINTVLEILMTGFMLPIMKPLLNVGLDVHKHSGGMNMRQAC